MVLKNPNMMMWSSKYRLTTLGSDPLKYCIGVKGLSYVEVMVSMLTSALFLSTTLQGYIAATGIKVKSQKMNTAIAAIQADIETIRHIAQVVPDTAECSRLSSGGYAQNVMSTVMNNDINLSQNQSPQSILGSIVEEESTLKQSSTLPIQGLDDYKLRRTLSLDKREVPAAQVLQIFYKVVQSTSSESAQIEADKNADQPQLASDQTEKPLAQLHTSILPNAALVCF
jgi:hypothetical protein